MSNLELFMINQDEILLRKAEIKDIPPMASLMGQLGYPQKPETLLDRYSVYTQQKHYGLIIAEYREDIIGLLAWSHSFLFVSDKVRFHIEALIVDKAFRSNGIGKKLVDHVENYAKTFTPCVIDLTSGIRRAGDGTHDFYKALGYQNDDFMAKLYFRKEMDK